MELLKEVNFRIERAGRKVAIAVVQDHESGELLMVAFMDREALDKTLEAGVMHYYSTSRKKLWKKGESSGHIQRVREVYLDCDGDAILFKVEQVEASCHTGYYSCFYRKLRDGRLEIVGRKVFEPKDVYSG